MHLPSLPSDAIVYPLSIGMDKREVPLSSLDDRPLLFVGGYFGGKPR